MRVALPAAIASLLVGAPVLAQRVATPAALADVPFEVFAGHPRCVFRPAGSAGSGRTFEQVRELYAGDATFRGIMDRALAQSPERQHAAANAACWIVSRDDRFADAAVRQLAEETITETRPGSYSQVWIFGSFSRIPSTSSLNAPWNTTETASALSHRYTSSSATYR